MRVGAGSNRSSLGDPAVDRCSRACHVKGDSVLIQLGCGSVCELVDFLITLNSSSFSLVISLLLDIVKTLKVFGKPVRDHYGKLIGKCFLRPILRSLEVIRGQI